MGYSLEAAISDIIDNSISAGSKHIRLFADLESRAIGILDDGHGMSEATLRDAMRPGSRNPLDERKRRDLGRFGLGLKTASFSQCRRLTVLSRKDESEFAARWDLDFVASKNDWLVQVLDDESQIPWKSDLGRHGTLVVWEEIDRISSPAPQPDVTKHFIRALDRVREHVALVFHRFLAGEQGLAKVEILLNGGAIAAFDPFAARHPATIAAPEEVISIAGHKMRVQSFTLPHRSKSTAKEYEANAGGAGYLRNQGFYIYREKRLIIHGTWFRLAKQTELTKLARVKVDIPNSLDEAWKIDVRKSSAQPPPEVLDRLRQLADSICAASKRVYTSKGARLNSEQALPVWVRSQDKNEISYRIDGDHPLFERFRSSLTSSQETEFLRLLDAVGATIPFASIYADCGNDLAQVAVGTVSDSVLEDLIHPMAARLLRSNVDGNSIRNLMQSIEPFKSNLNHSLRILNDFLATEGSHV